MKDQNNLIKEIQAGNKKYLNQFIKQNLNLVIRIAKAYMNRGVEFEDLVQEGTIGLYKAINKFNPDINPKFSSYASYWIKKSIMETIQKNSRTVYLPKHVDIKITHLKHTINKLMIKLNRYPTLDELLKETGISKEDINILYNHLQHSTSTNQKLDYILDEDGLPEDEMTLEDLIICNDLTLDEKIELSEKRKKVLELLETSNLSSKAKKILKLRYGFYNGVVYKYIEIAKMMGITSQAVRSCENYSMEKIRKNKIFLELALYLDKPEIEIKKIKKNIQSNKRKIKKHSNKSREAV